jgi:hypothetical protein
MNHTALSTFFPSKTCVIILYQMNHTALNAFFPSKTCVIILYQMNHTVLNAFFNQKRVLLFYILTAFDHNVFNIKMVNPATKLIYGLGSRGNYFSCTVSPIIACSMIPSAEYERVKVLSGVILAKEAKKVSVTDNQNSKNPVNPDFFTTTSGKKVGGKK